MNAQRHLKIGIDVGGTFTDFVVAGGHPAMRMHKTLSTPADPSIGVIAGLREIAAMLDPAIALEELVRSIDTIVHGTTVTTNATLTRNGARTGLLTTSGLRDALEMRRGVREEQYNNRCTNIRPLVPRYLRRGVAGRIDRDGHEIAPLDLSDIRQAIALFKQEQVEAIAICFMNSFANPDHERRAAELVRQEIPDGYLTVSTDLLPSIRFYDRVSTTVLNSYVGPILDHYLNQLVGRLKDIGFGGVLLIMQSNGGVMNPELAREKAALTLLSGPAGGPGAGLRYVRAHDRDQCIVIDMGGTSFEAALASGTPLVINEGELDRRRLALPMLDIHSIGAGGGSIGWLDAGGLLRMGPQSAGADPGPACYGRGGRLPTCTDANLVLGFLDPEFFAGGSIRLDMEAARAAIDEHIARPMGLSIEEAAAGMYRIICTNMAQGVREISIKRGFDAREFPLVVAGGAGPAHSCLICDELKIPLQIIPHESSVLCAAGMLMSDLRHDFVRTFVSTLANMDWDALHGIVTAMTQEGDVLLAQEGIRTDRRNHAVKVDCRYARQYHEVSVNVPPEVFAARDTGAIAAAFHAEHNRLYGYALDEQGTPVQIINVRVQAVGVVEKPEFQVLPAAGPDASQALKGERSVYSFDERAFRTVPVYDGHRLTHGNRIAGPALIEQVTTAIVISNQFDCIVDKYGSFVLHRREHADRAANAWPARGAPTVSDIDPILLSVYARAFKSITDEMSISVQKSTRSPILCEAKDFVTGLYDGAGNMLEQTENLPILAFSLAPVCKSILAYYGDDLYEGDVIFHNDVFSMGNQNNDVAVYKPIFIDNTLVAWAAVKGHQADIGGAVAGGYNPNATEVWQEALRIPAVKVVERGRLRKDVWNLIFANIRFDIVQHDLRAQMGACNIGDRRVHELIRKYGIESFRDHKQALFEATRRMMEAEIRKVPNGTYRGEGKVFYDGRHPGSEFTIRVTITVEDERIRFDYSDTDSQTNGFVNGTFTSSASATILTFLQMVNPDIPHNEGMIQPIEIVIPEGKILNASYPKATTFGNHLCPPNADAIIRALAPVMPERVTAGWNNLLCSLSTGYDRDKHDSFVDIFFMGMKGGSGAMRGTDGYDHIGMIDASGGVLDQDYEMFEQQTPHLLVKHEYLADSAGAGEWRGGLGTETIYRIGSENTQIVTFGDGDFEPAFGLFGGGPGSLNRIRLTYPDGTEVIPRNKDLIPGVPQGTVYHQIAGGGGGYGDPHRRDRHVLRQEIRDGIISPEQARARYGYDENE